VSTTPADRAARLTQLWVDHQPAIAAFARRRVDAATADDVVSEVFIVAWRRLDEVPRDERAWLIGVARNVVMTQQRGSQRALSLVSRVAAQPRAQLVAEDDEGAERVDLARAWSQLAEPDRELLALTAWDGLSVAQAASVLCIPRTTCAMRLLRARRRFATLADDDGPRPSFVPPTKGP